MEAWQTRVRTASRSTYLMAKTPSSLSDELQISKAGWWTLTNTHQGLGIFSINRGSAKMCDKGLLNEWLSNWWWQDRNAWTSNSLRRIEKHLETSLLTDYQKNKFQGLLLFFCLFKILARLCIVHINLTVFSFIFQYLQVICVLSAPQRLHLTPGGVQTRSGRVSRPPVIWHQRVKHL